MSAKRKVVLVTGFEPFGEDRLNPSEKLARDLDGEILAEAEVAGRVLPCVFGEAARVLVRWIEELDPAVILCLGQAGGREGITVERVAINVDDARIADNRGRKPVDQSIVEQGPVGYWSRLPIKAMVADLRAIGVPASVSQTAGTFVCNHVFYSLMHHLATRSPAKNVRAGFIHVPWLTEQGVTRPEEPSLPFEVQRRAIRQAIQTALTSEELLESGGAEH